MKNTRTMACPMYEISVYLKDCVIFMLTLLLGLGKPKDEYDAPPDGDTAEIIDRRALLPDVTDPKLWMCKTRGATERKSVIALLQRCFANPSLQVTLGARFRYVSFVLLSLHVLKPSSLVSIIFFLVSSVSAQFLSHSLSCSFGIVCCSQKRVSFVTFLAKDVSYLTFMSLFLVRETRSEITWIC